MSSMTVVFCVPFHFAFSPPDMELKSAAHHWAIVVTENKGVKH